MSDASAAGSGSPQAGSPQAGSVGADRATDRALVLVLTGEDDATAAAVITELRSRGARVAVIDTGDFPTRLRLAARTDGLPADGVSGWRGHLETVDGGRVELDAVGGVLYRRPTRFRMPEGLSEAEAAYAVSEARYGVGGLLACLDAVWVNEPSRIARAEYKPLGLTVAARCGLAVPRTLITNDQAELVEFAKRIDGPLVCKTLSSIALEQDGQVWLTYTTPVEVSDIDPEQLAVTAHLFQERVDKIRDVRVVMIGGQVFAFAIDTTSETGRLDWRSDYAALRYTLADVPADVAAGMRAYLETFGLIYGVFDAAITHDGWVIYECNPNGQWLWLAEATGAPVAAAFADALIGGTA